MNGLTKFPKPDAPTKLRESERAKLRDWYDDSGPWPERMSSLYRIIEGIIRRRADERMPADAATALALADDWDAIANDIGDDATCITAAQLRTCAHDLRVSLTGEWPDERG